MKVLLGEDAAQYTRALADYTQRLAPLQTALTAYAALGCPTVPTVAELAELQENPRRFLVRMLTNRQPLSLVGGMTVTPEKFWDLMDKPAGAEEFVATVEQLFPAQQGYGSNRLDVGDLELVSGQLQLKQATKDVLREQSRFYATTQRQVDEFTQLQALTAALNTIRRLPGFGHSFDTPLYLQKVLRYRGNGTGETDISINLQAVLTPR